MMPNPRTLQSPLAQRKLLYSLLGDLPNRHRPIRASLIKKEERETYVLEKLTLDLNGIEDVPALFTRPRNGAAPFPTILYNHAHGGDYLLGKRELIDARKEVLQPPYAEELARRGIACLCIDQWNFGERHGRTEQELFKEMLWKGQVLWGKMVYDNLRALDYLARRPDVDSQRMGTLGLSMGALMAWWTAALDTRIKVTVDMCCMTDFHELIAARGLDRHGIFFFVPCLLKHFDTASINALIAPRSHLSLNGNYDLLTPVRGLDSIDRAMKKVYKAAGKPESWRMFRRNHGHFEITEMRAEVVKWLDRWM